MCTKVCRGLLTTVIHASAERLKCNKHISQRQVLEFNRCRQQKSSLNSSLFHCATITFSRRQRTASLVSVWGKCGRFSYFLWLHFPSVSTSSSNGCRTLWPWKQNIKEASLRSGRTWFKVFDFFVSVHFFSLNFIPEMGLCTIFL